MDNSLKPLYKFARPKEKRERIFEIDFLRGFAVLLMIIIHAFWIFGYGPCSYFGADPNKFVDWFKPISRFFRFVFMAIVNPTGTTGWPYGQEGYWNNNTNLFFLEVFWAGMFIFLAGVSCSFAKNNVKRGFLLFYFSNLLSLVLEVASDIMCGAGRTPIYGGGIHIWCGILHAISIALLLYALFDHFFPKWWQTYIASIVLTIATGFSIWFGHAGGGELQLIDPVVNNAGDFFNNMFSLLFGLKRYGDDYFSPLLVTTALFFGATAGKTLYKKKKSLLPSFFNGKWAKPICFMGRHSLVFYLGHEMVLTALMVVIFLLCGYRFV